MNEKIKISKKDVKFLRNDLELDPDVVENLVKVQEERQKKFQSRIETAQEKALERYKKRITILKEAKTEAVKKYDEEIKKYEVLVSGLQEKTKDEKLNSGKPKKK